MVIDYFWGYPWVPYFQTTANDKNRGFATSAGLIRCQSKKNATSKRHAAQETTWTKSNPSNNKAYSFEDLFVPYHLGWSLEPHDRSQSNQITQKHRELVRRYGKCLPCKRLKKGHRTKIHSADLYTFHYFSIFFGISIIQTDGTRS
jgi:hypothetical protein